MTACFSSIRNVIQVNLPLKMLRSYLMRLANNMLYSFRLNAHVQ